MTRDQLIDPLNRDLELEYAAVIQYILIMEGEDVRDLRAAVYDTKKM